MPLVRLAVPVYLPNWLYRIMHWAKQSLMRQSLQLNLLGDRDVEWSFVAAHMPAGPGEALDFGCGGSHLSLLAARRGFCTTSVDLETHKFFWQHPQARFLQGDLLELEWPQERFDLVLNCSTVEHVGLPRRYGVIRADDDGDLKAMRLLREVMKPGAVMLLTVPCGQDAVFPPLHRVYGAQRLPRLLDGYAADHEEFWVKNRENQWVGADRQTALDFKPESRSSDPMESRYALGCFVLRKSAGCRTPGDSSMSAPS